MSHEKAKFALDFIIACSELEKSHPLGPIASETRKRATEYIRGYFAEPDLEESLQKLAKSTNAAMEACERELSQPEPEKAKEPAIEYRIVRWDDNPVLQTSQVCQFGPHANTRVVWDLNQPPWVEYHIETSLLWYPTRQAAYEAARDAMANITVTLNSIARLRKAAGLEDAK